MQVVRIIETDQDTCEVEVRLLSYEEAVARFGEGGAEFIWSNADQGEFELSW